LLIERLAIANAPPEELRPIGHRGKRVLLFREEAPETRVMPAELLTGTVPVLANAPAQLANLLQQLFAGETGQIFVHHCPPGLSARCSGPLGKLESRDAPFGRRLTA